MGPDHLPLLGLERAKGGADQKTPSYLISRRRCCCYLCLALSLVTFALCYGSREALGPAWAAAVAAKRATQAAAHSRLTRLHLEFERHLEHDIAEREWALLARARLLRLERDWRRNLTLATSKYTGASSAQCERRVAKELQASVQLDSKYMFAEMKRTLSVLDTLVERGAAADERHDTVQAEVLAEITRDKSEQEAFQEDHPEEVVEGNDDWRREIIERFYANMGAHFEESTTRITETSPVFAKLGALLNKAAEDEAAMSWRDAEAQLGSLRGALEDLGATPYVPNEESADDALDYVQLHHVIQYISELRWRARLNTARKALAASKVEYDAGGRKPADLVSQLETLEAKGGFPSDWLYASGLDGMDDIEFLGD